MIARIDCQLFFLSHWISAGYLHYTGTEKLCYFCPFYRAKTVGIVVVEVSISEDSYIGLCHLSNLTSLKHLAVMVPSLH